MALTDKLSAIGVAIREKTGGTELLTLDEMPIAIAAITTGGGGGGDLPAEALVISGNCNYRFANGGWDWFINTYGDRITTKDITFCLSMFQNSNIETLPFDINCSGISDSLNYMFSGCGRLKKVPSIDFKMVYVRSASNMFSQCSNLEEIGTLKGIKVSEAQSMFASCHRLKKAPVFEDLDTSEMQTKTYSNSANGLFYSCWLLEDDNLGETLKYFKNPLASSYGSLYNQTLGSCYCLPGVSEFPVIPMATNTSNRFQNTFSNCASMRYLTFETNNGAPLNEPNWFNQVIDLSTIGYATYRNDMPNYTDRTLETEITDVDSYNALKDNPKAWTADPGWSLYTEVAAVQTINSLPDVSSGNGNTIKFMSTAGYERTGKSFQEAIGEEAIAAAAAKGWTVSFV